MKYYIGIDPGREGAYGVINDKGELVAYGEMPYNGDEFDAFKFAKLINPYKNSSDVYFEKVGGMPNQSCVSTFSFGKTTGMQLAVIKVLRIPYEEVRPVEWKQHVLKGMAWKAKIVRFSTPKGTDKKTKAILKKEHNDKYKAANALAKRTAKLVSGYYVVKKYPNADIKRGIRVKKIHDGISDAICLGYYGYLKNTGML